MKTNFYLIKTLKIWRRRFFSSDVNVVAVVVVVVVDAVSFRRSILRERFEVTSSKFRLIRRKCKSPLTCKLNKLLCNVWS